MFQFDFVVALVMLFILLPAGRFVRRFVFALFDMFDRGNPIDEAGKSSLTAARTLMNLTKTAGIAKMAFGGGRGGGGGPGPSSPSANTGGSGPDRMAGIMNEQQLSVIDGGMTQTSASGLNTLSEKSGKTSEARYENQPDLSVSQEADIPKTYGYLPEQQLEKDSIAEQFKTTGTDDALRYRDLKRSTPQTFKSGDVDRGFSSVLSDKGQANKQRTVSALQRSSVGSTVPVTRKRESSVSVSQKATAGALRTALPNHRTSSPASHLVVNRSSGHHRHNVSTDQQGSVGRASSMTQRGNIHSKDSAFRQGHTWRNATIAQRGQTNALQSRKVVQFPQIGYGTGHRDVGRKARFTATSRKANLPHSSPLSRQTNTLRSSEHSANTKTAGLTSGSREPSETFSRSLSMQGQRIVGHEQKVRSYTAERIQDEAES